MRYAHVPVIVNPASGPDRPILKMLNTAFRAAQLDWDLYLTKKAGDAERLTRDLLARGAEVIAVCGGDGTVKEAARALVGSPVPLAVFPGGSGNALAVELGLPLDLALAVALLGGPHATRAIDVGEIDGHYFILRASMGFETEMLRSTPRELKDQIGSLAYPLSALPQLGTLPAIRYRIWCDGEYAEAEGVLCTIANSAQIGLSGLTLAQGTSLADGRLDVIVLTSIDLLTLAELATSNMTQLDLGLQIQHWQGQLIKVEADPPQAVAFGEDVIAQTPVTARCVPGAVRVIVPQ